MATIKVVMRCQNQTSSLIVITMRLWKETTLMTLNSSLEIKMKKKGKIKEKRSKGVEGLQNKRRRL